MPQTAEIETTQTIDGVTTVLDPAPAEQNAHRVSRRASYSTTDEKNASSISIDVHADGFDAAAVEQVVQKTLAAAVAAAST